LRLYADRGPRRVRQVLGDLLVLGVGYLMVTVALQVRDAIASLGTVGVQLHRSGRTVSQGADRAVEAVDGVPGLGGALAAPFGTISGAGRQLTAAGAQVEGATATLAFLVSALLIGLTLGYVLFRYLPGRIRWVHEAAEVERLLQGPDAARLLAHRAVANRPLRMLRRRGGEDVAADLADGRWERLAAIELDVLGLDAQRLRPASEPVSG
jgi:hypothetical protein